MRKFLVIWSGQFVSAIGSNMTLFGLIIWAWEKTSTASALAFISFAFLAPNLITGLFTGIIVDKFDRKFLIILGDVIIGLFSIILLLIYLQDSLQIWRIYTLVALISPFAQLQSLARSTIVTNLVTSENYSRASSLTSIIGYASQIIAPPLAGFLYPIFGLKVILLIDLLTLIFAVFTVIITPIISPKSSSSSFDLKENFQVSISYLKENRSLLILIVIEIFFWFIHDIGNTLFDPLILSRTKGDTVILGSVSAAAGFGGVTGGLIITVLGGTKNKFKGLLMGMMGAGICKICFGFGQSALIWIPLQFCSSTNFPLIYSSRQAIYLAKIKPEIQGRIFAFSSWLRLGVGAIASLLAGILADRIFEPLMMKENILTPIFGSEKGAGISLLYVLTSVGLLLIGGLGWRYNLPKKIKSQ